MSYKRVVSLAPSLTETIFAFNAGALVAGVTDSCDFPYEVGRKPHVCSWFDPDLERLLALKPDLVLGLGAVHGGLGHFFITNNIDCQLFNPITIGDVLADTARLGELLGVTGAAKTLVDTLQNRLEKLDRAVERISPERRMTVCRVLDIEDDQLIVAGPLSFQYDVIARAGGINVTSAFDVAYPKVPFRQFQRWDAEMIFVCGSDARYLAKLKAEEKWQTLRAVSGNRLYQFDCGLTCRTSPRIVDMAELLFQVLYG